MGKMQRGVSSELELYTHGDIAAVIINGRSRLRVVKIPGTVGAIVIIRARVIAVVP